MQHTDETDDTAATSPTRPAAFRRLWTRILGAVAVLALLGALWLATDRQAVMEWKEQAGPVPFFIALAILPAVGLPTTPFFVVAGAFYGPWIALAGSAAAIAANLALCYAISKSTLRPWLERLIGRTRFNPPDMRSSARRAVRFTLLVRIAPGPPTFAKSYLLGMAGVPFATYFGVSFAVTYLYAASFIVLGDSILDRNWAAGGIALGVLALAAAAVWWIRRRRRHAKNTGTDTEPGTVDA